MIVAAAPLVAAFWRPMAHAGLLKLAADLLRYLPPERLRSAHAASLV